MAKPDLSTSTAPAAASPVLAQLLARKKMLEEKISKRIPASADRKDEALGRAKFHLSQVKEEIATLEKK